MANKIIHKHSSVITDGKAKLPVASQLEYGELAINYAEGVETISMKNSANNIVEIKSTNYLEKIIIDNELVTAAALTNLDERIEEIDSAFNDAIDNAISETNAKVTKNELVTAAALTNLDERIKKVDSTFNDAISETNAKVTKNELVTAAALTNLDERIEEIDSTFGDAISETNEKIVEIAGTFDNAISETNAKVTKNELVTAYALTDLDDRLSNIEDADYASDLAQIYEEIGTIDTKIEEQIGSANIEIGEQIETINTTIEENEHVVAAALTDLDKRLKIVETNGGGGGGNAGDLTELESRVAQLEQTIATLQETLANVTAQLANTLTVE
jgi:uncharacterized coiled-coil protein SlyX